MNKQSFGSGMIGAGLGILVIMGVACSQPPAEEPVEPMPTEIPMELPEAAGRPADFEQAEGPVSQYDEGVLFCGTDAMPALDQDPYGNWWAYCEPALVDQP